MFLVIKEIMLQSFFYTELLLKCIRKYHQHQQKKNRTYRYVMADRIPGGA